MYSISVSLEIAASAADIFEALTNQDLLSRWFAPQVIAVPVEGTVAAFAFEFDLNFKMELVQLKKDKMVHWKCVDGYKDWLDSEVVFSFEKVEDHTLIKFKHGNLTNEEKRDKTVNSWHEYLQNLKRLCETEIKLSVIL